MTMEKNNKYRQNQKFNRKVRGESLEPFKP